MSRLGGLVNSGNAKGGTFALADRAWTFAWALTWAVTGLRPRHWRRAR